MIPAQFDLKRASSAAEAISLLGEYGDEAKLLAGGHSLIPLMKLRLAQPSMLIDIGRITDLSYIKDAGNHIAIGALKSTNGNVISGIFDIGEVGNTTNVNQHARLRQAKFHQWNKAVSTGEQLCFIAVFTK